MIPNNGLVTNFYDDEEEHFDSKIPELEPGDS